MGIGYGVGIYDFALIRRSFLNLGIAVLISRPPPQRTS
jgi:hypothetical protein